jgi:hypothetical protein
MTSKEISSDQGDRLVVMGKAEKRLIGLAEW